MRKILIIFLLIFVIGCTKNIDKNLGEILIENGEKTVRIAVEIADDDEEVTMGLMFRENLDENSGMFFVFGDENYRSFWMKNTLIPLDIIFIGENFEIVDIEYAVPCKEDPCALYKSSKPAKYVLEVNADFTAKNNIGIGDKIAFKQ